MRAPHSPILLRLFCLAQLSMLSACGGGGGSAGSPPSGTALVYSTPQRLTLDTGMGTLIPSTTDNFTQYSVTPPLPAGLTLNPSNGHISGTPTVTSAAATYRITATHTKGAAVFDLNLAVQYTQPFWLEPARATTIGVGQVIQLSAAYMANASANYPSYVDPSLVTWSSSQPTCATVNTLGRVTGVSNCNTVITASYLGHSRQVPIQVSGAWVTRNINVSGQGARSYALYIPDFGATSGPHPALLSLHGGGGSAVLQAASSLLANLGQQQKAYIAFLEGTGAIKTFNAGACCGSAKSNNVNDVDYARAVLDDLQSSYSINTQKVYASGMSNGGMMAHRLACQMSDRLAGIAAISGASAEFDQNLTRYYSCVPSKRIPILHVHATNDRNYPFGGGLGDGLSATPFYSVDATIADWRNRNNVSATASVSRLTATTTCYRYATAANALTTHAPVTLCKIDPVDVYDSTNEIVFGGGHAWPGGTRSPSSSSDTPVMDFIVNDYMWHYFSADGN